MQNARQQLNALIHGDMPIALREAVNSELVYDHEHMIVDGQVYITFDYDLDVSDADMHAHIAEFSAHYPNTTGKGANFSLNTADFRGTAYFGEVQNLVSEDAFESYATWMGWRD